MNRNLPTFAEAEARNKLSHFTVQGFDLNGVVHAGTNDGEEIYNYLRFGIDYIIGFEPLGPAFTLCYNNCEQWQRELGPAKQLINAKIALSDRNGSAAFNITAGDGKGSSLLEPNLQHPEVKKHWLDGQDTIVTRDHVRIRRFDDWVRENRDIDLANYDTLVLDTQGNEMDILAGMGETLKGFKYLCVELSLTSVYKGEIPGPEVAKYLTSQGFTADSPELDHNDWFFVRSDIKPTSSRQYLGKC